jgi:hypothetical protein
MLKQGINCSNEKKYIYEEIDESKLQLETQKDMGRRSARLLAWPLGAKPTGPPPRTQAYQPVACSQSPDIFVLTSSTR